jgi:DNA-binding PadR family transcriptional regulator
MTRRSGSNTLALAVLALLFERPMHPYEIATTLRDRRNEDSIKIRFGSLYTVIDLLKGDGLIKPLETTRQGRRPERTMYALSPDGEAAMTEWLSELIGEPVKEYRLFEGALCLLVALRPEVAIALLKQRVQRLENAFQLLRAELDGPLAKGLPPLFLVEHEYRLSLIHAERQFVVSLLRRIDEEHWATSPAWTRLHRHGSRSRQKKGTFVTDTT